ncbi:618_t:CDS:2, partial [Cetraspora pellucida]
KTTNSIKPSQNAAPSNGFSMQIQSNKSKNKKLEKRNLSLFASEPNKKRRITDDDINQPTIELVTGFEDNQIQSLNPKERSDLPITIPALKNADWLERSQALVSASDKVKTTSVKKLDNSVKTTSAKTLDNSIVSLKQQALDEILK